MSQELHRLLIPPDSPLELPSEADWRRLERSFGALPTDYHQFLRTYGTGTIDDFLWIFNPASKNDFLEFETAAKRNLDALRETAAQFPQDFPMALHPEPGGFLPFGVSDNGDTLFWVTRGSANQWTVAVMGPRSREVFQFQGGLVEFLVAILGRTIVCDRFPSDFPGEPPVAFRATPT